MTNIFLMLNVWHKWFDNYLTKIWCIIWSILNILFKTNEFHDIELFDHFNYLDDYLIQIIGFQDNSSLKLFSIIWSILDLAPLASHLLLFDHTTLASVPVHSHQHLLQQVCAHLSSLAYQHCQSSSWPVGDPNFPILTWIWLLPQNITLFSIQPFNAQSQNPYRF